MVLSQQPFAGERVGFALGPTVLGLALVARTKKGVAALLIGDSEAALIDMEGVA